MHRRELQRGKPLVMSDALASNSADEAGLIHCHCLAHGRRKFSELAEVFPAESTVVTDALKLVFEHDEAAHEQQLSAEERLRYHQRYSAPIMEMLKGWLEQQTAERAVEPNSSLGKASAYLLGHWETLTRFLTEPGAPVDNNTAEVRLVGQKPSTQRVWGIGPEERRNTILGPQNLIPVSVEFRPSVVKD